MDLCGRHYQRFRSYGTTQDPKLRRMWANVEKTETCWLWRGYVSLDGYGQYAGRLAHRQVYEIEVGPIPLGLHLDHLCRVRYCVNPAHLEPVTPRENIRRGDGGKSWGFTVTPGRSAPVRVKATECSTVECRKVPYKRDLCRPHYRVWLKDPDRQSQQLTANRSSPEERFWAKVAKGDSCWLWQASWNRMTGYGQFSPRHGQGGMAHRYSYQLANGPIPEGMDIHHTCNVRLCVNPAHLVAATRAENLAARPNRRD